MEPLMVVLVMHQRADGYEALSARPDAPVLPYVANARAHRARRSLEHALRGLADAIAPPPPARPVRGNTC
jgi:hypothetical protein